MHAAAKKPILLPFLIVENLKFVCKYCLILLSVLSLLSCSGGGTAEELTYRVERRAFQNVLYVEGTVEPVVSTVLATPRVPSSEIVIATLVEDGTLVQAGEVVCVLEANELSLEYDELLIEIQEAEASLNKVRADLEMQYALLEAQVKNNEAQTQIALLDSAQLTFAPANQRRITELELQSAQIERTKLRGQLEALKVIQASDLIGQEYRLQRRRSRAEQLKTTLDALTVRAPAAGLVLREVSWITGEMLQVGDMVFDTQPLLTIPGLEEMKVMISARESDYKYMNVGDSVNYTFGAMPGVKASGRIRMKTPVGRPVTRESTVKVFDVEASIERTDSVPDPGFSAGCYITLKEIPDTLVIPQVAVYTLDSLKVVYLRRGKRGYEAREIRTGEASPKETIVAAGLRAGEEILLVQPEAERVGEVTRLEADSVAKK